MKFLFLLAWCSWKDICVSRPAMSEMRTCERATNMDPQGFTLNLFFSSAFFVFKKFEEFVRCCTGHMKEKSEKDLCWSRYTFALRKRQRSATELWNKDHKTTTETSRKSKKNRRRQTNKNFFCESLPYLWIVKMRTQVSDFSYLIWWLTTQVWKSWTP